MPDINSMLYLTQADVMKTNITMKEVLDTLEDVYRVKAGTNYELPSKIGVHPYKVNYVHAMPCWGAEWDTVGIKWGAGYGGNPKRGLPFINALIVLNDVETGVPYCVMDANWITAIRTGGKSGFSAKHFARKNSTTVAMMACGAQARQALHAMVAACPNLTTFKCWDFYPEAGDRFVAEMKACYPHLNIFRCETPKEAVVDADIVHSAAPSGPLDISVIEKDWLKPGVTSLTMDIDILWKEGSVEGVFHKYFTDEVKQFYYFRDDRHEVRVIPEVPVEYGPVITGEIPGRENDDENIFVINIGNMLDDTPIAREVYERAMKMGIGTKLPPISTK